MKAFIVETFSPKGNGFGLHQFDKSLQINFRGGDILLGNAALGRHPLHSVGDPCLQKQLTRRIDRERVSGLKNGYPKLFVQRCGGHNQ